MRKTIALATSVERRKLRKQFCASLARGRFYTAWVIRDRVVPATRSAMSAMLLKRKQLRSNINSATSHSTSETGARNHAHELGHCEWTGTDLPDGQISHLAVQPHFQKYFPSGFTQITSISPRVPRP